jgi:hypothetical protein
VDTKVVSVAVTWEATLGQQPREVMLLAVATREQLAREVVPPVSMAVEVAEDTLEAGRVSSPPEEEVQATVRIQSYSQHQAIALPREVRIFRGRWH